MKYLLLVLILFLGNFVLTAQPSIEWQKSLGGTAVDAARYVQQTTDGGYIVAGYTASVNGDVSINYGSRDVWVVKLNPLGIIDWEKTYGGIGSDEAYQIHQTTDGGYIITGMTDSNDFFGTGNGNDDILIFKIDALGMVEWGHKFGSVSVDRGHSVTQIADGGYLIAGFTASAGVWVKKLDANGNEDSSWLTSTFGGSQAYSVNETSDGGVIVGGYSENSSSSRDARVLKLDAFSNVEWDYSYGGSSADYAYAVRETPDGGYIMAGMTQSNDGDITNNYGAQDFWVVKLNALGMMQWQKTYGGTQNDFATDISLTSDGGYIVTGQTNSDDNDVSGNPGSFVYDYWVIKIDTIGTLQWQSCLGGTSSDFGNSIQQTDDGGYMVAGRALSNNYDVSGNHGDYDMWVIKLESETLGYETTESAENIRVYPNPADNIVNIETSQEMDGLQLFDCLGKQVVVDRISNNQLDVSALSTGIYYLEVHTASKTVLKKIMIN